MTAHPLAEFGPLVRDAVAATELGNASYNAQRQALDAWREAVAKARRVKADPDLTAQAKARRVRELLTAAAGERDAALGASLAPARAHLAGLRDRVADAARGSRPDTEMGAVLHELRAMRWAAELRALEPSDRRRLILETAATGDRSLVDTVEGAPSLLRGMAPTTLDEARERFTEATAGELLVEVEAAEEAVEALELSARLAAGAVADRLAGDLTAATKEAAAAAAREAERRERREALGLDPETGEPLPEPVADPEPEPEPVAPLTAEDGARMAGDIEAAALEQLAEATGAGAV